MPYAYHGANDNRYNSPLNEPIVAGARLIEDFDEPRKEITVANVGEIDLSIRLRLSEYMEIGGQPLIENTVRDDFSTWTVHFAQSSAEADALLRQYYQWVLGENVVSMGEWIQSGAAPGPFWVYDPYSGWIYWGEMLKPEETTSPVLRLVNRVGAPSTDWYYSIHTVMYAASLGNLAVSGFDPASPRWTDYSQQKTNEFRGMTLSVQLNATKSAEGAALPDGRFDFGLFNGNGNLISVATADGAGDAVFPPLTFSETEVAEYAIRELSRNGGNWIVDDAVFPVVVTVSEDDGGRLYAVVSYPEGAPHFTNIYSPAPSSESIAVYKQLIGWNGEEIPFSFGLFDQAGNLVGTAENREGVAEFPMRAYDAPGVFNYTVREISQRGDGWATDPSVFPVIVTVTEVEDELVALATYPEGRPVFTNIYTPEPAQAVLTARKRTTGAPLRTGRFTFAVFGSDGTPLAAATNDAAGDIVFPALTFTAPGVTVFSIRETSASGGGWETDRRIHTATITVTDDGLGRLSASISYPQGEIVFVNAFVNGDQKSACATRRDCFTVRRADYRGICRCRNGRRGSC